VISWFLNILEAAILES